LSPRKRGRSPVGAHVPAGGGLARTALPYAQRIGAEAVQVFLGNPRGWAATTGSPSQDSAFREGCGEAGMPVFLHAPYLINFGSPVLTTVERSVESLRHAFARGAAVGARGVVLHAGSAVDPAHRDAAGIALRELLLPLLDGLGDGDPALLIEPTAGGGAPLAATVADLGPYFDLLERHPRLGVCLDTCHLYAAGQDIATPGGLRSALGSLVRTVGRGRLQLIHANDSRDPLGSNRDRHQTIGAGAIGLEPFAELFRHPAVHGVPVVVETPGGEAGHTRDVALLKTLRDDRD
jgi:deoxyribonuclease-4